MSGQPALPRGSGPGSREGEGAETLTGHSSPPKGPESTLSSPHKASIWVFSSEAGIRICWQGAGPEWRGQPCDGFPACGAANKGGFLFVPRPRAWVPSDTSVRSSQSSVTAGGQAERVPVRSDGARTGLGEAGRAHGGRPPGGGGLVSSEAGPRVRRGSGRRAALPCPPTPGSAGNIHHLGGGGGGSRAGPTLGQHSSCSAAREGRPFLQLANSCAAAAGRLWRLGYTGRRTHVRCHPSQPRIS